jgi:hypothetical protein
MKCIDPRNRLSLIALWAGVALLAAGVTLASAQAPNERIAALKTTLEEGLAKRKAYEWIETTVVFRKGEEKSRKQNRCYYGADGNVQKVPIETAGASGGGGRKPRGLRGRVAKNKKEGIQDAVKGAAALVKEYVPPSPEKIQAAKDDGRLAVSPSDGGRVEMVIKDYFKKGDSVTLRLDLANNVVQGLEVATYMEKEKQAVNLTADLASLPDGTIYPGSIVLDITSENIRINIKNSGHRPVSP